MDILGNPAVIGFFLFFGLLALNVPVFASLGGATLFTMVVLGAAPLSMMPFVISSSLDSFPLLATPLFIIAGNMLDAHRHRGAAGQRRRDRLRAHARRPGADDAGHRLRARLDERLEHRHRRRAELPHRRDGQLRLPASVRGRRRRRRLHLRRRHPAVDQLHHLWRHQRDLDPEAVRVRCHTWAADAAHARGLHAGGVDRQGLPPGRGRALVAAVLQSAARGLLGPDGAGDHPRRHLQPACSPPPRPRRWR